jgi:glucosamine-6-phosphate isomerase
MRRVIFESYQDLSVKTAEQIAGIIGEKPDSLLCFPAGETSLGTFKELIALNRKGIISFRKSRIVGLDEWLGLGDMKSGNCYSFLKKHLFDHIDYSPENMCFFDGESGSPEQECIRTDDFIRKYGPVDMMLLGAGMNGHLGLNEPGTSFDLYSHIVDLDEVTKTVGQKYFPEKVRLERGITIGIRHIMEARTVILQISGAGKSGVVGKLIRSEISEDFPASVLKSHPDSWLLIDREAAGQN